MSKRTGFIESMLINNGEAIGAAKEAGGHYDPWNYSMPASRALYLPNYINATKPVLLAGRTEQLPNGTRILKVVIYNQDYPLRYEMVSRGIAMKAADDEIRKNHLPILPEV